MATVPIAVLRTPALVARTGAAGVVDIVEWNGALENMVTQYVSTEAFQATCREVEQPHSPRKINIRSGDSSSDRKRKVDSSNTTWQPMLAAVLQDVLRTGPSLPHTELRKTTLAKKGPRMHLNISISKLNCKEETLFVELRDVTRQESMEQRFFHILETSFDGFWDWWIKEDFEYMSPAFWRMFGFEPEEKEHHPSAWMDMIFPEDLETTTELLNRHFSSRGKESFFVEVRYRHKNGSTVTVFCKGRVVEWDDDGSPVRMIGTHTDVTESKANKAAQQELEIQLTKKRSQLEAEKRLNDFMAHEVRNPLAAALAANDFVFDDLGALAAAQGGATAERAQTLRKDLSVARSSLMYINELLEGVLDLSKLTQLGSITLNEEELSLRDHVVMPVVEVFSCRTLATIELIAEVSEPLFVRADGLRLKQVLINLVSNSAKFVQSGFIKVEAFRRDPGTVVLRVTDSGPGLNALEEAKANDSPPSAHRVAVSQGNGIGLKLSTSLIKAMKGTLRSDDSYRCELAQGGPGACFEIILPFPEVHMSSAVPEDQGDSTKRKTRRRFSDLGETSMLIVDDDPAIRMMSLKRFSRLCPNWSLQTAVNGEEALDVVFDGLKSFDIVLMDHFMPLSGGKLNGTETIQALRSRGFEGIIIGSSGNEMGPMHIRAGANHFWRKPLPKSSVIVDDLRALTTRYM